MHGASRIYSLSWATISRFCHPKGNPQCGSDCLGPFPVISHCMTKALSHSTVKPNQNQLSKLSNHSHSKSNKTVTVISVSWIFKGSIKFLQSYHQYPLPLSSKKGCIYLCQMTSRLRASDFIYYTISLQKAVCYLSFTLLIKGDNIYQKTHYYVRQKAKIGFSK